MRFHFVGAYFDFRRRYGPNLIRTIGIGTRSIAINPNNVDAHLGPSLPYIWNANSYHTIKISPTSQWLKATK
jgi:hypothetical protein